MADNPFDQFDQPVVPAATGGNPFDQFDDAGGHDTGGPLSSDPASGSGPSGAASLSLGDVAGQAAENIVPSAVKTAGSIYDAVRHPIDTGAALISAGRGAGQELAHAIRGDTDTHDKTDQEQSFDAVKDYFGKRYGSFEGFKKAVATDPVGVGTDLSVLFTGAGGLAREVPGVVGKAGDIAATAGKVTNPIRAIGKTTAALADPIGTGMTDIIGGLGTHTGGDSLRLAAQAGRQGGDAAQAFLDNMRGSAPLEDVVTSAKGAVSQLKAERGAAYRAGMGDVAKDQTVLSFDPIDQALAKTNGVKNFKGIDTSPATAATRGEVGSLIAQWKSLDPAEYHTPEGFDAMKQRIGDIRDNLPYGTPQRVVADNAYHAVRGAITDQAPGYAKVMKDYETASGLIDNIQKTLSLNPKASVDTSLRKLQSIMRNNVNSNYGQRADLAQVLTEHGAPNLQYQLAGQSLNKLTPRGLGAAEAGIPIIAAAASGNVAPLAALPFMSPRLMGEAAYATGAAGRKLAPVASAIGKVAPEAGAAAYEAASPEEASLVYPPLRLPGAIADGQEEDPKLASATDTLLRLSGQPPQGYAEGGHVHEEAAKTHPDPSDAQIEAGNYRKGHVKLHGFDISIETPQGAPRRGTSKDGKEWETRHETAHYGYLKRTEGADEEHVDAYIGPHPASKRIFVINQFDPATKKFDEHKLVFGASGPREARAVYDGGFSDGSGPKRRWSVHEVAPHDLKVWLSAGKRARPFPKAGAIA